MTTQPRIHGMTPRGQATVARSPLLEGRFGRMFRKLPACPLDPAVLPSVAESMREVDAGTGGWGGGGAPSADGDNPEIPAGYTYFGQFIDHDVTFDATSRLQVQNDLDALIDFRTPRFDLDSLYGSGPIDEPFQYDQKRPGRLLLGSNDAGEPDLPRNSQGTAVIGDPRNDENIIVSQLQLSFLKLHNKLADQVEAEGFQPEEQRFDETRRRVRWHYQWVVVHDYLKRLCGEALVDKLIGADDTGLPDWKLRYYRPTKNPYLPIEFSAAAFRFGHSQVRPAYNLNTGVPNIPIFVPGDEVDEHADLRGGRRLPSGWTVNWPDFLPIDGSTPQPSRLINTRLSSALFDLPRFPETDPQSLALRNLIRGQDMQLPSGQAVAEHLRIAPLAPEQLSPAPTPTPLWYYLLKEAELSGADAGTGGHCLGAVGARIVAEVLLGLLRNDPSSYINQQPNWRPELAGDSGVDRTFGLPDLIKFATT